MSTGVFERPGEEFDEFVRNASAGLLRLAVLMVRDLGHAEDLVQLALMRTASRWRVACREPSAYARQVLVNLVKDRWRNRSRRPLEVQDLAGIEPVQESLAESLAERDAVSRLVAELPLGQRKVLVLRYFEDLPVAEVADILGCSEGNVKSQSNRALATLRKSLRAAQLTDAREKQHAH